MNKGWPPRSVKGCLRISYVVLARLCQPPKVPGHFVVTTNGHVLELLCQGLGHRQWFGCSVLAPSYTVKDIKSLMVVSYLAFRTECNLALIGQVGGEIQPATPAMPHKDVSSLH